MKALFIATTIFIALNTYARATTIVIIWGPSDIVVGADSKLTTGEGKEYQLACKIGIERNVVWAAAGGLGFTDNVSVADIVSTEMTKLLQIQPTLQNIMNVLIIKFSAVISYLRTANLHIARDIGVTITFGCFEGNVLNIDFNQIKLLDQAGPSDKLQTIRLHCPNDVGCTTSGTSAMGQFETIQAELSSDPNIVKSWASRERLSILLKRSRMFTRIRLAAQLL
jgi:hypothetical protein